MKKIIKYIINHIPRPVMQRVAHLATRLTAIFYIGNKVECPICGHHYRKFLPYGYTVVRENALCPHCLSLERHRLLWLFLDNYMQLTEQKEATLLHMAPERCLMDKLESLFGDGYLTADIESPLAKLKMDIRNIPLAENSMDIIFCNHILEHIDDDQLAMRELYRVMKNGGWGVLLSPVNYSLAITREAPANSTAEQRYELFGQADHMREYGLDYADRLRSVGFEVEEIRYAESLTPQQCKRYSIINEIVYLVRKR
ncbi:MAG: class I SAM-dependent methyltransferase [Tidjanibacter sp.]|nr:class I SAM-dependent methyltransferase [Tidjanibacter sp.]